jgi:hypothetical protein
VVSRLQNKESSLNDFHCSVGRAKFLDHSYSTHKDPVVKRWLGRHPRFELHFTPPVHPGICLACFCGVVAEITDWRNAGSLIVQDDVRFW